MLPIAVCQLKNIYLTQRYREQARSHTGSLLLYPNNLCVLTLEHWRSSRQLWLAIQVQQHLIEYR